MSSPGENLYDQAARNLGQANYDEALLSISRAIDVDPDNHEYRLFRAELAFEMQLFEVGVNDVSLVIEQVPENDSLREAIVLRARLYEGAGNYEETLKDISWLIRDRPEPELYRWQAELYRRLGNQSKVAESLRHLVDASAEGVLKDYLLLIKAYYRLGQFADALKAADTAVLHYSKVRASLYHLRGLTYLKLNRKEDALMDFNTVLTLDSREAISNIDEYPFLHATPDEYE